MMVGSLFPTDTLMIADTYTTRKLQVTTFS